MDIHLFKKLWLGFICLLYVGGLFFIFTQSNKQPVNTFGAGYSPVTGYETRTTSYVSASATTIPVASVNDKAGNAISTTLISSSSTVRMYFNFEAGTSREEPFFCTGISGLNLTGCVRGIAFQGDSLSSSSTIAVAHNAGAKVILTNLGVMYGNEFVGVSGAQTKFDVLSFNSFPRTTSTTAVPASNAEFATWYSVQTLVSGGFSSLNASTTLAVDTFTGLTNCATSGTCVGVNASSTPSINGGFLTYVYEIGSTIKKKLVWDVISFLAGNWTWSGTQTFSNVLGGLLKVPSMTTSTTSGLAAVNFDTLDQFMATGTAGMPIPTGKALFISSTGTLFLTHADITSSTYSYVGFSASSSNVGQTVLYVRPGGIARGLTGFASIGQKVYLGNTPGGATSTYPESVPAFVGMTLSTSTMQLYPADYHALKTFAYNGIGAQSTFITGAWLPNKVTIYYTNTSTVAWQWNNTPINGSTQANASSTGGGCANMTITTTTNGYVLNNPSGCTGSQQARTFEEYDLNGYDLH